MSVVKYYDTGSAQWIAAAYGAQGVQGLQGTQGLQGPQGPSVTAGPGLQYVSGIVQLQSPTGTGNNVVLQNTPTLTTPNIGAATGTSVIVTGQLQGTSIQRTGGTSAQFLKADGSVDGNTYITGLTGAVLTAGGSTITPPTADIKGLIIKPATTGLSATITGASVTSSFASITGGSITASTATTTITGISSTAGLAIGMKLTKTAGTGVFGGTAGTTVIKSVDSATQITIFSTAANTAGTITFSVAPPTGGVTYTATNSFSVGQLVSVTGVVPSTLNPTYIYSEIVGANSTTFTIIAGLTGVYTSGGTATAWSNTQEWQNPSGTASAQINALGASKFTGLINEFSLTNGIHLGVGGGVSIGSDTSPRLLFVPPGVTDYLSNWQIDVNAGVFRWFTPGNVAMSLTTAGALSVASTVSASGQIQALSAGSTADGTGQIYLNGSTSNRIEFSTTGSNAPSYTTRSSGTKILLYPQTTGSSVDHAIGLDANTHWVSVPTSAHFFKWYAGTTLVGTLTGAGVFTTTSLIGNQIQITSSSGGVKGVTVKPAAAGLTATITNAVQSAGTVTYTATNSFTAGQQVTITGITPTTFNVTNATIASATGSNFTIVNASLGGTYSSGGTATAYANLQEWQTNAGVSQVVVNQAGYVTTPNTELVMEQTGDSYGTSRLRLQNRGGQNGPLFDTSNSTVDLVDFGFKSISGQGNIRYEARAFSAAATITNGPEFQIGNTQLTAQGGLLGSATSFPLIVGTGLTDRKIQINSTTGNTVPLTIKGIATNTATITGATVTTFANITGTLITPQGVSVGVSRITGIASTANLLPGMTLTYVSGAGTFGGGTGQIISVDTATSISIYTTASSVAGSITFSIQNSVTYTATNTFSQTQNVTITGATAGTLNVANAFIGAVTASNFTIINTTASGTWSSGGTATITQSAGLTSWIGSAGTSVASIDTSGNVTATSLIKSGGTSAQFLKADGSVDSSTYAAASAVATVAGVRAATQVLAKQSYVGSNNIIPAYSSPAGYDTAIDSLSLTNLNAGSASIKMFLTNKNIENQKYIAVAQGPSTNASTSTDGITWTLTTMPVSAAWRSVAYGNGVFAAVANSATSAATSTDGITWTLTTLPSSASWYLVTYGNGVFVAVAYGPTTTAASSTDGITWTLRTMPSSANWRTVTYGNGVFAAVANNSTTAASSTDGVTWTLRTMPASATWSSTTYGNGIFAAVANGPSTNAASSTDGITWTLRTLPAVAFWVSVAYGNGVFATIAPSSSSAASSTDGVTWTLRTNASSSANWNAMVYGNGVFVAISPSSTTASSSTDGITWTLRTMPSSANWQGVASGHVQDYELIYKNTALATNATGWLDANKYDPIFVPAGYSVIAQSSVSPVNIQLSGEKWVNT